MARDRSDALRRIFAEHIPSVGEEAALGRDELRHLGVLRLGPGDDIMLFDGKGAQARATLTSKGAIIGERWVAEKSAALVLVVGLPKGGKADEIVRMATELGATAIHFASTEHSVPKLEAKRSAKRQLRWARIAREAARQSERAVVPEVLPPAPLKEVALRAPLAARRFVAWARGGSRPSPGGDAWIAIGPEGGFTTGELTELEAIGWIPITLGAHVLRVDTAVAAALAIVGLARD